MDITIVALLVEGIGFARDILRFFSPKPAELERSERLVSTSLAHSTAREEMKFLDEKDLQRVIDETNQHLEKLIRTQVQKIVVETRRQRVRDAIQDVQARVVALKALTSMKDLDPGIAMQLVLSALNPLHVSLEVGKLRLQEYGSEEAWLFCSIVGKSALLTGYNFLGQEMPQLKMELQGTILSTQEKVLDRAAEQIIASGRRIPWAQVPQLLTPEGADGLLALYQNVQNPKSAGETKRTGGGESTSSKQKDEDNISKMTVAAAAAMIRRVRSAKKLKELAAQERREKARKGILDAINLRLQQL